MRFESSDSRNNDAGVRLQTTVSAFDVKEFLEDVKEELNASMKAGQEIQIENSGDGQFVTDKRLLKNILINLLSNAVKFSAENTSIQLNAVQTGNKLILSVKDQGIGISGEDQKHLFTSFFRGKNVINIQGTGLGLHIVKRYADLIQGELQLESKLGTGTTVIIEIPDLS